MVITCWKQGGSSGIFFYFIVLDRTRQATRGVNHPRKDEEVEKNPSKPQTSKFLGKKPQLKVKPKTFSLEKVPKSSCWPPHIGALCGGRCLEGRTSCGLEKHSRTKDFWAYSLVCFLGFPKNVRFLGLLFAIFFKQTNVFGLPKEDLWLKQKKPGGLGQEAAGPMGLSGAEIFERLWGTSEAKRSVDWAPVGTEEGKT